MTDSCYDIIIIGAGPGGYVTALHAAQRGLKAILVEERLPGGVCLHEGCIPTKTMLAGASLIRQVKKAARHGFTPEPPAVPLAGLAAQRQQVIKQLSDGLRFLLQKSRVEVIPGHGQLRSTRSVAVLSQDGTLQRELTAARAVVLATGSQPVLPPGIIPDGERVLTSRDLLRLETLPSELLILGGGYVGCEFASLFSSLGSRVTLLEGESRLLPGLDADLGKALENSFKRSGIQVATGCQVTQVRAGQRVEVECGSSRTFLGDQLLVAVGRRPALADLGLEQAGVAFSQRGIEVNECLETSLPGVYAIGDVTGLTALAHVASAHGRLVIANLTGSERFSIKDRVIPACVFTSPEIASAGLSEEQARQQGCKVRTGRFPFAATGRAQASGETEGFVKWVADEATGRLLGGHIIGPQAAELIATMTLALEWGLTAQQITRTLFAHPTFSEAIFEAAEAVVGKPTHLASSS